MLTPAMILEVVKTLTCEKLFKDTDFEFLL